eukprot:765697-Hanusia_phi.AAC.2
MLFFEEEDKGTLSDLARGKERSPSSVGTPAPLPREDVLQARGDISRRLRCRDVDTEARKVEFAQVTTAKKHSFKLKYFLQALIALGIPAGAGWNLRVIFVTLQTHLKQFQIEPAKDSGALEGNGWEAGRESQQAEVGALDITV